MLFPFYMNPSEYEILYWAEHRSSIYEGDKIKSELITKEPEIVVFHKEGLPVCLGAQGHPELMEPCKLHKFLNDLIRSYVA